MILAVEDDPVAAQLIEETLRPLRQPFVVVGTVADAMARAARSAPTVIVCDLGLPDGDGLALARTIRGLPGMRSVPLIFCTSDVSAASVSTAIRLGGVDYVAKPIDPHALRERVQRALQKARVA